MNSNQGLVLYYLASTRDEQIARESLSPAAVARRELITHPPPPATASRLVVALRSTSHSSTDIDGSLRRCPRRHRWDVPSTGLSDMAPDQRAWWGRGDSNP